MNPNRIDQADVSKPFLNDAQLAEDLQQNRLREKETLDHFAIDSVASMDALTVALNEGRKDSALKEIETLIQLSRNIHADTLEITIESLQLAVLNDEATEAVRAIIAKTLTAYQGTLALVKERQTSLT
jgi:hypothetical protein